MSSVLNRISIDLLHIPFSLESSFRRRPFLKLLSYFKICAISDLVYSVSIQTIARLYLRKPPSIFTKYKTIGSSESKHFDLNLNSTFPEVMTKM